jgi:hypothetical protein
MRNRIVSPIDPPLALDDVRVALGVIGLSFDAVSFERMPGIVRASFGFQIGNLMVYGVGESKSLHCLCIRRRGSSVQEPTLLGLQRLMSVHGLYLVDWCRMDVLAPNDATSLAGYFSG